MALDVVRVLKREPECALLVLAEINKIVGGDRHIKSAVERWTKLLEEPELFEARARMMTEGLALLAAAALLRAYAPEVVADAFIASRLGQYSQQTYGAFIATAGIPEILARAAPSPRS